MCILPDRNFQTNNSANRTNAGRPPAAFATTSKASSAVMRESIATAAMDTSMNVTPKLAEHAFMASGTLV